MRYMKTSKIKSATHDVFIFARRLLCVPKCASCGERLSPFAEDDILSHGKVCLCKNCLSAWHKAKSKMCNFCFKTADKCTCMPKKNTFMQPTIPSLFFYSSDQKLPESKAIYTLKHKRYAELFDFVAEELAPKISDLIKELDISPEDCVMTYIPRTKRGLKKNGFDQSELLSDKLCEKLGAAASLPLLTRNGGTEQKKLSKNKRRQNAESTLFANISMRGMKNRSQKNFSEFLSGKTVILIDDIITTGESVGRGVKVLRMAGVNTVLVASVARCQTAKKGDKKTYKKT